MGVVDIQEALRIAQERELDLVEMNPVTPGSAPSSGPRTCKLMDFGKYRYQQTKKSRGQKKAPNRQKEVKLRPKTEEHDFQVKIDRAKRFLEKGHKVLVSMQFRGREMVHIELGTDLLFRFAELLEDCAKVEKAPSRSGRNRVDMILLAR